MADITQPLNWTKGEFFEGGSLAPYQWLMAKQGDAMQFEFGRRKLEEYMESIGIKTPGRLVQAYIRQHSGGVRLADHVVEFPDVHLVGKHPSNCGAYTCEGGVMREGKLGEPISVCPHPIMPIERLVNVDTGEVKIRLAYLRGKSWDTGKIFDKAILSNARNITQLAACGIGVTSESAKELVRYLAYMEDLNYEDIPETPMTERLGWVEGYGFSPYVDGLTYDSGGQFAEEYKAVRCGGNREAWMELARDVRKNGPVSTRIALAASFASVLVKKLNALPFIVHLWGAQSGIGKSVALILAASVWAYPEIGYYVKTTKATDVALEQLAYFAGNMPLCLDELQLIQSKKNFDETVYALCEGTGKARGAKTGGLQQQKRWNNAIITTGEMPITAATSKAGAVNRVVEIEITQPTFASARDAYQTLVHNYGHAGREFVEKLSDRDALDVARDAQERFYEAMRGKATDKQVLAASIILAGDYMAELLIFNDGIVLTPEDILPHLVTTEKADTNGRAYQWLCDWIASNPSRFDPGENGYVGECWGAFEEEHGAAVRCCIIKSVFDRMMTENGFNPASFLSWAIGAGKIRTGADGASKRATRMKRIKGLKAPARCVVLNLPSEEDEEDVSGAVSDAGEEDEKVFVQTEIETPFDPPF